MRDVEYWLAAALHALHGLHLRSRRDLPAQHAGVPSCTAPMQKPRELIWLFTVMTITWC